MIKGELVRFSKLEYDWECWGFWVNEGLVVVVYGNKLFISYLVSVIDENYCMGLLWINVNDDLCDLVNWYKLLCLVFIISYENCQYGLGYNSFM